MSHDETMTLPRTDDLRRDKMQETDDVSTMI